jgi:formylglycine-generating enzyme required for sulfatase activity
VTKGQFKLFQDERDIDTFDIERYSSTSDSPQVAVDWYDAAAYCNWLSEKEGIPENQWCYLPTDDDRFADGMQPAPDYLKRIGYRLPSEAEWEFACRAGAATARFYGESVKLLPHYAQYLDNSQDRTWPVGSLKPNDYGIFDMLGNAYEWCHERYDPNAYRSDGDTIPDAEDMAVVRDTERRVLRGGSFLNVAPDSRSANRDHNQPDDRNVVTGFRVSRTYP